MLLVFPAEKNMLGECAVCGEHKMHAADCATLLRRQLTIPGCAKCRWWRDIRGGVLVDAPPPPTCSIGACTLAHLPGEPGWRVAVDLDPTLTSHPTMHIITVHEFCCVRFEAL